MDKPTVEKALNWPNGEMTQLSWVLMSSLANGSTVESLAAALGVARDELQGIIVDLNGSDNLFDQGVAMLRIEYTGGIIGRDTGWDGLEHAVLKKLNSLVANNSIRDPDVLTRIATAANRAKRSNESPATPKGVGVHVDENGVSILAGGNVGVIRLSLGQRVMDQIQRKPDMVDVTPMKSGHIEMLKLADVRTMVGEIQPDPVETVQRRIVVDEEMMQGVDIDSASIEESLGIKVA